MPPKQRRQARTEAAEHDLFPAMWPVCAWQFFAHDLLSAVYGKSDDLWSVIRQRCFRIGTGLGHLEYEGDIDRNSSFNTATEHMPEWTETEVALQQARNLLGRETWASLITTAEIKGRDAQR